MIGRSMEHILKRSWVDPGTAMPVQFHSRPLRTMLGHPGRAERAVMLLAFIFVIGARLPDVVLHGRVWAEEGTIFLRNAAILPWTRALFQPVGGYLNLVANLAGLAGIHLVPLEQVRFIGVVTGLLFQILPAILILSSGLLWLRTRISLVASLLLIATVPIAEEVWLNSLHPQFHLTLCAALILAMGPAQGWRRWFHLLLILLGALCGPTTWFLFPLFTARAVIDRSPSRALQAVALGVGILLQALLFYHAAQIERAPLNPGGVVEAFFLKNVLIPWLDYQTARAIAAGLMSLATSGTFPVGLALAEAVVICLIGMLLWRRGRNSAFWLFAGAIVIAVPSYAAARGGTLDMLVVGSGNRYAFVPQVLLALVVLWVGVVARAWVGMVARIGVVWLLAVGILEFHDDPMYKIFSRGPSWTDQVAAWHTDHAHLLRIWPQDWTVNLNVSKLRSESAGQ